MVTQAISENIPAENRSTAAIANRVAFAGGEPSESIDLMIDGASGREGS